MTLIGEQGKLKADYNAVENEMQQLDSKQFANIWKNPVSAKDYEALKERLPAKKAYFQANNKTDMLALCDEFEKTGKNTHSQRTSSQRLRSHWIVFRIISKSQDLS